MYRNQSQLTVAPPMAWSLRMMMVAGKRFWPCRAVNLFINLESLSIPTIYAFCMGNDASYSFTHHLIPVVTFHVRSRRHISHFEKRVLSPTLALNKAHNSDNNDFIRQCLKSLFLISSENLRIL